MCDAVHLAALPAPAVKKIVRTYPLQHAAVDRTYFVIKFASVVPHRDRQIL
jgi:hypothetical protein